MAEPKRGSVKAFKAAEERRKARVASKGKFKIFGKAGSFDSPKKAEAKRKFNEKVAAANKKRINQDSVKKFKAAEERRQVRLAKVNAVRPGSPKGKRIAAKRAEADVEKDLPKSKIPTATATTVGTAVGTAASQAKKVPNTTKTLPRAKPDLKGAASSFGEAFKKARAQGVGTKFAYNDKMYSAVTRDDISRAGKSSLQDFLNSAKRKDTKIAKAPGQIIKKRYGGRISVKQEDIKKARKKVSDEAEQRNIELKNRNKGGSISKSRRMSQQGERRKGVMGIGILGGTYKRPSVENAKTKMRALKDSFEDKTHPMKKERIMDAMKSKFAERRERKPSSKVFASGGSVMARGCRLGRKKPTKMY